MAFSNRQNGCNQSLGRTDNQKCLRLNLAPFNVMRCQSRVSRQTAESWRIALFEKARRLATATSVMSYHLEDWCQRDSVQFSGMPGAQLADEISPAWPGGRLSIGVGQSGVCFCLDQRADKSAASTDCRPSFPMSWGPATYFSPPYRFGEFFTFFRQCLWQLDISACTHLFMIELSSGFKSATVW